MAFDQNRSGKAAKPGGARERPQNRFGEGASERSGDGSGGSGGSGGQHLVNAFSVGLGAFERREGSNNGAHRQRPESPFGEGASQRRGGGSFASHRGRQDRFGTGAFGRRPGEGGGVPRGGVPRGGVPRGGVPRGGVPRGGRGNRFGAGALERGGGGQRRGHGAANEDRRGGHNRPQRVLGKRTRDDSQEADIGLALKRANVTGQATSQRLTHDQVDVERNLFGEILNVRASDPGGPKNFSMPSLTEEGATDVIFKPHQKEGWNTVADVTRRYIEQGFETIKVTVKPMAVEDTRRSQYGRPMDPTNARVIEELSDSDSESACCEACEATSHETKDCPIPSFRGDTVVDPFCNLSIKAQGKGDTTHHSLDGKRATHQQHQENLLYCPTLIAFERAEANTSVAMLFNTLVVNRRRMPPIRVFKDRYCFIQIAILASERHCKGQMPRALEGVWPYTKQDALKHRSSLKRFDELGWRGMPEGELEGMTWEEVKREYMAGRIPKQIHGVRHDPVLAGPSTPATTVDGAQDVAMDKSQDVVEAVAFEDTNGPVDETLPTTSTDDAGDVQMDGSRDVVEAVAFEDTNGPVDETLPITSTNDAGDVEMDGPRDVVEAIAFANEEGSSQKSSHTDDTDDDRWADELVDDDEEESEEKQEGTGQVIDALADEINYSDEE